MSFNTKRRVADIKPGIHLVAITKVYAFTAADKSYIKDDDGSIGIIVKFQTGEGRVHEQLFWCDGGSKQKFLDHVLWCVGVDNSKGQINSNDIVRKRLWIYVLASVNTSKGNVEMSTDGQMVRRYYMFDCKPFNGVDKKPIEKYEPKEGDDENALNPPFVKYVEVDHLPEVQPVGKPPWNEESNGKPSFT
jgi:hypothetical protein